jgi:hypothetical protein
VQRADKVSNKGEKHELDVSIQNNGDGKKEYDECLACQ